MLEKTIERQLVKEVKKMGGRAVKFVSPGCDGMPDRLVLLPKGRIAFVEVKAPGKKPRALQIARHEMLRDLGFCVYVLDSIEGIGDMLDDIYTT
jgi:Holliday junction resolvase